MITELLSWRRLLCPACCRGAHVFWKPQHYYNSSGCEWGDTDGPNVVRVRSEDDLPLDEHGVWDLVDGMTYLIVQPIRID